jgi:hypothetical protein
LPPPRPSITHRVLEAMIGAMVENSVGRWRCSIPGHSAGRVGSGQVRYVRKRAQAEMVKF